MTTTTKIFVILVCLFAFIFTPMAIQFAGRSRDWRHLYLGLLDGAETAQANAQSMKAIAQAETQHYQAQRDRAQDQSRKLELSITGLQEERDGLIRGKAEIVRERDGLQTSTRRQSATVRILTQQNEGLIGAKERLTKSESELRTTNIGLVDRVDDLTVTIAIIREQLDKREQQMAAARQENQKLRQELGLGSSGEFEAVTPTPSVKGTTPVAASPIRGQVTEVRGDLVTVNVGTRSGVLKDMVLVVLRNNNYIGDIHITSQIVDNEAVGQIALGGQQVKRGDIVMDEPTFSGR